MESVRRRRPPDPWRANRLAAACQNHSGGRRGAGLRHVRSLRAVYRVGGTNAGRLARRIRDAASGQPARPGKLAADGCRPRSPWATPRFRCSDASATPRHMDGARPRSRCPDLTRAGPPGTPARWDPGKPIYESSADNRDDVCVSSPRREGGAGAFTPRSSAKSRSASSSSALGCGYQEASCHRCSGVAFSVALPKSAP